MYKLKLLPLLFFISAGIPLFSNDGLLNAMPESINTPEFSCSLPAPSGLQVTNVTTNSVTVQWTPVAGAASYEATAYDSITNVILSGPVSAGIASAYLGGLPSGRAIKVGVVALCSNGELSPNTAYVYTRTDIVIEIVHKNCVSCAPGIWNSHIFNGEAFTENLLLGEKYLCKVVRQGQISEFTLEIINNTTHICMISNAVGEVMGGGNIATFGQFNQQALCTFRVQSLTNSARLNFFEVEYRPDYVFWISRCTTNRPGDDTGTKLRSDDTQQFLSTATISPNPFTDRLQIQFGENDTEGDAQVQLFHINGALVQTKKQALADGNSCELLTETLPAGMYLLRIETPVGSVARLVTKAGQ